MDPSVFTNDSAECRAPEQCRNSKGPADISIHFGGGYSAVPELITSAQLTAWSSSPIPEQMNHLSCGSQKNLSMANPAASSQWLEFPWTAI